MARRQPAHQQWRAVLDDRGLGAGSAGKFGVEGVLAKKSAMILDLFSAACILWILGESIWKLPQSAYGSSPAVQRLKHGGPYRSKAFTA